jgi:hypothetical protein
MNYWTWRSAVPDELDALCADYLERLRAALGDVERSDREQIIAQVSEHLSEARAALPRQNESSIHEVLERLGSPDDIAAAAVSDRETERRSKRSWRPMWAGVGVLIVVLALGGAAFAGAFGGGTSGPPSAPGPPLIAVVVVPNVVGVSPAEAAATLEAAGLYNSIDNLDCSTKIGSGKTVSESPVPGSQVARGTRISIQVACQP